jgi:Ca2+-transporting ATPase
MSNNNRNWHALTAQAALESTGSRTAGLNSAEIVKLQETYGFNELKAKKKKPVWLVFLQQFLNPLIYVLMAAAAISLVSQLFTHEEHYIDAIVIGVVILLNAVIGTFQEMQAEKPCRR